MEAKLPIGDSGLDDGDVGWEEGDGKDPVTWLLPAAVFEMLILRLLATRRSSESGEEQRFCFLCLL